MPSPQITNPAGVWGTSSLSGYTGDERSPLVEEMRAAVSTITRGDIVALSSSSGYVIRCLTDTAARLIIGVALSSQTTAGNPVPVVIHGPFYGANKDNTVAVTAGDPVTRSAAVTATVLSLSQATAVTQIKDVQGIVGVVMADATAGATTCDIFVGTPI